MYIVYKTINKINGRYYIGYHKQKSEDFDHYYGSGNLLKRAIKKHGKENFIREILFSFHNKEAATLKEKELVTLELVLDENCYNIRIGGDGGNTRIGKTKEELELIKKKYLITKLRNNKKDSLEVREKKKLAAKNRIKLFPHTLPHNKNRKHEGKALENMRKAAKNKLGEYYWINNGISTKLIKQNGQIPEGFTKGNLSYFLDKKHSEISKSKIANHPNIKGIKCYTDGINNIKLQFGIDPPEGFRPGMTRRKK
jgi:hypothetical protein